MLSAEMPPAEGARYAAGLVCIPGLWAGSGVWRGFASHLGHRGWECHLLDVRGVAGGLAARAAAVRE
jgi:pimeloyl-ACP methyl ester carboxylesterase